MTDPRTSTAFFDVALAQRACRRFDPERPVTDEDLERIPFTDPTEAEPT
jgi:hypothetical protein